MNIKPGKWRMRNGKCAEVEFRSSANNPCKWIGYDLSDNALMSWGDCGLFRPSDKEESDYDLIEPWTDKPLVNWSAMPAWAKWVAMDENGQWFWYGIKPEQKGVRFGGPYSGLIPSEFSPSFTCNWRDSLVERPSA